MKELHSALLRLPEMVTLCERLSRRPAPAAVWGISAVHKAHLAAALAGQEVRPAVILVPDEAAAHALLSDIAALSGHEAALLPAREPIYYDVETGGVTAQSARIAGLWQLLSGAPFTVIPMEALALRTLPAEILRRAALRISVGQEFPPEELCRRLSDMGYTATSLCEGPGQFARRGGIVDVFSPSGDMPLRIEFFDTEIDGIAPFSVETQRRDTGVSEALILPALEFLPDLVPGDREKLADGLDALISRQSGRKKVPEKLPETLRRDAEALRSGSRITAVDRLIPLLYPDLCCAADLLPENALVFVDDPRRCEERLQALLRRHGEDAAALMEAGVISDAQSALYLDAAALWNRIAGRAPILMDTLSASGYPIRPAAGYSIMAKVLPSYGGSLDSAAEDFTGYTDAGYSVVFLAGGAVRAERISEALREKGLPVSLDLELSAPPAPGHITVTVGSLSAGMEYPALRLCVITEGQLSAPRGRKAPRKKASGAPRIRSFTDLHPGDLVVHDAYGIGSFVGIEKISVDGAERDFIKIRYAGTDSLFLPATALDQLSKYVGAAEDSGVRLNKLGGTEWHRTKARAKGAAKEMAKELIALYAERQRRPGFAFPEDSDWQQEFEEAFEYEETADQLRTVAEIKADMEKPHPMDRLLCGDVGFGKTEVAFRAIMKCVMSGKQAAILVPTTVLARQHHQSAIHRFRGYPIRVACLSRFTPPAAVREIQRGMRSGALDLVVGTHKLLQKDIAFKDLGLLVVDEEQRFGVSHKEKLKEMTKTVDVLTLSATPIPRTLNMALSGIRDLSVLEEAPLGRYPVQTYVMEYNPDLIGDAIRREMARGGQVYFMHNRIDSIHQTAARLKKLVPEARIAVGHGQMSQEELEEVMQQVSEGECDVFVCTTIIESGVDIPNVNTLIVEDAERYGLAQLHQIRGRVGRSTRHAYAYFTYRPGRMLTEVAEKRLSAIREFAEFGAGMKIAMRDLEIRGAGNLLGAEQSGHMMSVGYDMYLKLLEEAVLEEKGEKAAVRTECTADIAVSAHIPERLVSSSGERMDLYRRIAFIRTAEDAEDMTDEIIDRYGDCPASVTALIQIALLRADAGVAGVSEIKQNSGHLNFTFASPDFRLLSSLCALSSFKGRIFLNAGEKPYISLRLRSGEKPLDAARAFLSAYAELALKEPPANK